MTADGSTEPRPLVILVEWTENGESCREVYGPWTPAEDDSHLESVTRFLKGWPSKHVIEADAVTMFLCLDPEESAGAR